MVVEALLCLYGCYWSKRASECNTIDHDILQIKFEVHLNKEIVNCGATQMFSTFKPVNFFIISVASKKGCYSFRR